MNSTAADFPEKLKILFEPKRYKVLWGGRGAGRSWGAARALLILGTQRPIRVLCAREYQNSISESVHKLLSDQIENMGLGGFYDIQKQGIYGKNGTSFAFEGIKNNTTRIKSYEGVDYCWVEEAVKVSAASWQVLLPTIRKEVPRDWRERGMAKPDFQSEIWLTFNPELEEDYTYQRFVKNADPKSTAVVHMNYHDNPFFPSVLLTELESDKTRDYDMYLNVWEGQCRQVLAGAVYANEMKRARVDGRITTVPWDRATPVSTAWDLGRADKTSIWFFQTVAMQTRVLAYFEDSLQGDVLYYAKELQSRAFTYDTFWLPHDAYAKRLGTKLTIQEQLQEHFPNVNIRKVPNQSLTDGINISRITLAKCWFDENSCADGLRSLNRYSYKIIGYREDGKTPIFSDKPQHDDQYDSSHGADAFRYLSIGLSRGLSSRRDKGGIIERLVGPKANPTPEFSGRGGQSTGTGWMR